MWPTEPSSEVLNPAWCDGIGLVRTELLLRSKHYLMDERKAV